MQKVVRKYIRDPRCLTDLVRCVIIHKEVPFNHIFQRRACARMHTRTQTTMPICMHACVHVCMLRTYVRTCIHTSIRTCMHAYIRTCIYTYIHVCLSVCLPEKGEALVCMFVCIYQIYIRIYIVDGFLSQRTGPVRPTVSHNLHTSQTRCIFDIKASPSFILFSYCS